MDPAIFKTVDRSVVHVLETLVFTVMVTNRGTANANDVVVTDAIHPRLDNVTLTSTKGSTSYDSVTRVWTVNVGVLAPNETVTIVIRGRAVGVSQADLPYQITNMGTVAFLEGVARNSNIVVVDVLPVPTDIPEAGTWLMLGGGLAGLAGYAQMRIRSRRRKAA